MTPLTPSPPSTCAVCHDTGLIGPPFKFCRCKRGKRARKVHPTVCEITNLRGQK